jgi:hypothetical protein
MSKFRFGVTEVNSKEEMVQTLSKMKGLTHEKRGIESWYSKACKFLAGIENRLETITLDDFSVAMHYFFDCLLPQAV